MTNLLKKFIYIVYAVILSSLTSCAVIGGIFKAGMWVGVLGVVLVVGLIFYIISRVGGSKK